MLLRIGEEDWLDSGDISRVKVDGNVLVIRIKSNKKERIVLNKGSIEGRAILYWVNVNAKDIIKHYEGLRVKDENKS